MYKTITIWKKNLEYFKIIMEQSKIHHETSQDYYGRANLVKALPHVHLDIFCFFCV
jgi:hypothetical protein